MVTPVGEDKRNVYHLTLILKIFRIVKTIIVGLKIFMVLKLLEKHIMRGLAFVMYGHVVQYCPSSQSEQNATITEMLQVHGNTSGESKRNAYHLTLILKLLG